MQYPDFNDVVEQATKIIMAGHIVHQKFTCAMCGLNQTMGEINRFFQRGKCEGCKYETDLVKNGCGFLLVTRASPAH